MEQKNEVAIARAEELEHKRLRTPEEDTLLMLLVTLIEKFEEEHYPMPQADPHSMLLHLMEAQNTKAADLAEVIGVDKDIVLEIINSNRDIDKNWAKALGEFFHVSPLFI